MSDEPTGTAGLDLARQRTCGQIIAAALRTYRNYPLLFLALALAVIAPFELAALIVTGYGPLGRSHETLLTRWVLIAAETSLVTPLVSALHMRAVMTIAEGRRPQLRKVSKTGVRVLPLVGATALLVSIGTWVGFIALVVPGIVLAITWAVAIQTAAVEHEGVRAAMRRSMRLTAGHYRHVVGLLLIIWLIAIASDLLSHALPLGRSSSFPSVLVGIAYFTFVASFSALTLALLYLDLRDRYVEGEHQPRQATGRFASMSWPWGISLAIGIGLVLDSALHRRHYASAHLSVRIFGAVLTCLAIVLALRLAIFIVAWVLDRLRGA